LEAIGLGILHAIHLPSSPFIINELSFYFSGPGGCPTRPLLKLAIFEPYYYANFVCIHLYAIFLCQLLVGFLVFIFIFGCAAPGPTSLSMLPQYALRTKIFIYGFLAFTFTFFPFLFVCLFLLPFKLLLAI
jgi:hypothetical protein